MVFKRINKDTVRCILTEQDMIDNGLQIEDFFKNLFQGIKERYRVFWKILWNRQKSR